MGTTGISVRALASCLPDRIRVQRSLWLGGSKICSCWGRWQSVCMCVHVCVGGEWLSQNPRAAVHSSSSVASPLHHTPPLSQPPIPRQESGGWPGAVCVHSGPVGSSQGLGKVTLQGCGWTDFLRRGASRTDRPMSLMCLGSHYTSFHSLARQKNASWTPKGSEGAEKGRGFLALSITFPVPRVLSGVVGRRQRCTLRICVLASPTFFIWGPHWQTRKGPPMCISWQAP